MSINQAIWGNPESWHNTYVYDSTSMAGATILRCSRPKVPDFDGTSTYTSSQLITGITEQKIEKNKPIDKSMCPCGQDVGASHLHFIGVYTNRNRTQYPDEDIQRVTTIVNMGMRTTPINWCFFERRVPNTYGNRAFGVWRIENDTDTYRVWLPGSDNSTSPTNHTNGNYYVSPFLDYQLKSILLAIQVFRITGRNATTGIPTGSWITLEAWKNDYNTDSIAGARLQMLAPSSNGTSLSQITYYSVSPASERGFGAMILDEIPVGTTGYSISPSFMSFGIQGDGNGYIYFFDIIQNLYGDKSDSDLTYGFLPCDGAFTSSETRTYRGTASPYGAVWQEVPYDDDTYNSLMSMAALYGCYFTPTSTKVFPIAFTHADLCLPIIDENGIAHGDYTRGSANPQNDLYNADKVQDKNYTPGGDIDDNTYSKQTYFNPVLNLTSMCKRYVLDDAAVEQLCRDLWKISDDLIHTDPNEDFKDYDQLMLDNFLVNSPIDVIVSLDKYPINDIPTGTTAEPIKYGKAAGAALGKPLTVNTIFFNFSGVHIYPKFGRSFLDYSPYTTYELYIPFCGVIQIEAGDIMDHTLSVQMVMDLSTGAVTAYVMADNLCIETANGMAALNIPVSGIDSVTLNSQINNALINAKSSQMQARSTGTLTGRIGGGLKSVKESLNPKTATMQKATDTWAANLADYELTHQQLNPHKIGSASAACSWSLELTCRLMIYYPEGDAIDSSGGVSPISPKLANLTLYGHTTGFSCISSGAVSNYHGFTVGNIDTSSISGATEQERDMIKSLFARGVYLP